MDVPMISTEYGDYNKERKSMQFSCNGVYPLRISVFSVHSGRTVVFVQDEVAAQNNEFWDGEMYEYIPEDVYLPNLKKITLYPSDRPTYRFEYNPSCGIR